MVFGDDHRPYPSSYRPYLDLTGELDAELTNRLQQILGIIKGSIEPTSRDIMTEVSRLSLNVCLPHEGHLNSV